MGCLARAQRDEKKKESPTAAAEPVTRRIRISHFKKTFLTTSVLYDQCRGGHSGLHHGAELKIADSELTAMQSF